MSTFFQQASEYIKAEYSTTLEDMEISEADCLQAEQEGDSPADFIDRFATKYNLTSVREINFGKLF